jgi:hypothetical protein
VTLRKLTLYADVHTLPRGACLIEGLFPSASINNVINLNVMSQTGRVRVSGQYTNKLGRFHVTRGEIEKCEIWGSTRRKKKNQGIVLLEGKVRKRFTFCFVNYLNLPLWRSFDKRSYSQEGS